MDPSAALEEVGLVGSGFAAPIDGGAGVGFRADELVTPASVMKVQVALTVENSIATGGVDGAARRWMRPARRTAGPVGISLMRDEVSMSVRDLVVAMLTISDNAAADELIDVVGLDQINETTRALGMVSTLITSNLRDMLDALARDAGFTTYAALAAHDCATDGPPSDEEVRDRLASGATLDPARGTRTTAAETVALLRAIWSDRAGPPEACAAVRSAMGRQLTRQRIASAFGPEVNIAAKSGGLMGVVRNEAAVVTFADGRAYAVAVHTRANPKTAPDPRVTDDAIGATARALIDQLRT